MVLFLAAIAGAGFGGADQYFGSLSAIPWLVDTSLLSAPWLSLPFLGARTTNCCELQLQAIDYASYTGSTTTFSSTTGTAIPSSDVSVMCFNATCR
jgi:hypothetical protein